MPPGLLSCSPGGFSINITCDPEFPSPSRSGNRVIDLAGRSVRTFLNGEMATRGRNELIWDGRNDAGRLMSSGVYFYSLKAGEFAKTKRMVLIK